MLKKLRKANILNSQQRAEEREVDQRCKSKNQKWRKIECIVLSQSSQKAYYGEQDTIKAQKRVFR